MLGATVSFRSTIYHDILRGGDGVSANERTGYKEPVLWPNILHYLLAISDGMVE